MTASTLLVLFRPNGLVALFAPPEDLLSSLPPPPAQAASALVSGASAAVASAPRRRVRRSKRPIWSVILCCLSLRGDGFGVQFLCVSGVSLLRMFTTRDPRFGSRSAA